MDIKPKRTNIIQKPALQLAIHYFRGLHPDRLKADIECIDHMAAFAKWYAEHDPEGYEIVCEAMEEEND
jgi:hypothetical protein